MRNLKRSNLFRKNPFRRVKKTAVAAIMAAITSAALANPSGPQVRHGNVNIQGLGSANVNIEQLTQQAIVNWEAFSIGPNEAVQFLQPNQMAVILNRVTGQDPSQILGQLRANGNVWLINPNGILFGPNSTVDVGGLVASTLGITDENFLAGNYTFEQDPNFDLASIVNQGTITIDDGGYAVLTAPLVSNEGLIVANLGRVVLAGAEKTTLNFDGRNLINYEIAGLNGDPGTVVLTHETVSAVLNNMLGVNDRASGLVQREDGTFALEGASGTVYQGGTIRADGAPGQEAGIVALDSARLTVLGEDSVTAADGVGANSNGGTVYALSNRGLNGETGGKIVGQKGSLLSSVAGDSGDGGFIEFSAENFNFASTVETAAFLLDPRDIFIVDGNTNTIAGTAPNDDQTIGDGVLESITAQVITLQATRDIIFNISGTSGGTDTDLNLLGLTTPNPADPESNSHLVLRAGRNVDFGTDRIIVEAIDILAGGDVTGGIIQANDLDIGVDASGGLNPAFDGAPSGSGLARSTGTAYANNIVRVSPSSAPAGSQQANLANRAEARIGGSVDISFERLTAPAGTTLATPANYELPEANTVDQDLTVLAEGDITLTDVTPALPGNQINLQDQIRTERFRNEQNKAESNAIVSPGIQSFSGDITITTERFFAAGKGDSNGVASGDDGNNNVVADSVGATVSITAGAIQDRSGQRQDVTARNGLMELTATRGNIGGITVNGTTGAVTFSDALPFDIVAESLIATALVPGARVGLDIEGGSASMDLLDLTVNDGAVGLRDLQADSDPVTAGIQPSTLTFNPMTTQLSTNGAISVNKARFANQGNIRIVDAQVRNILILEAIAEGGDPGNIIDDDGGPGNDITLNNANSTIGLIAEGGVATLANPIEIASVASGNLSFDAGAGGFFANITGDIDVDQAVLFTDVADPPRVTRTLVGGTSDGNARLNATGDITVLQDITLPTSGSQLDLIAGGDIDFSTGVVLNDPFDPGDDGTNFADVTVGDAAGGTTVLRAGGNLTQDENGVITSRVLALDVSGDVGVAGGGTDVNAVDVDVDFLDFDIGGNANILDSNGFNTTGGVADLNGVTDGNGATVAAGGSLELESGGFINVDRPLTIGTSGEVVSGGFLDIFSTITAGDNLVLSGATGVRGTVGAPITADAIGISTGATIDAFPANGILQIVADELSYDAGGTVQIADISGDLELVASVTAVDETVAGASSGDGATVNASAGSLTVSTDVVNSTSGNVDLLAADDIALNADVTNTDRNVVVRAGSDAGDNITQTDGNTITAAGVGLQAGGDISDTAGPSAGGELDINATTLAFDAGNDIVVQDLTGGITITNTVTGFAETVTTNAGGNSGRRIRVETAGGGDITVNAGNGITHTGGVGGGIDLASTGDIALNNGLLSGSDLVLIATDNITQTNGTIDVTNLGIQTTNGDVGSAGDLFQFDTTDLTVNVGNDAFLQDTAGGVNLTDSESGAFVGVIGNSAENLHLDADGGAAADLRVSGDVDVTDSLDLVADNDVILDDNIVAGNDIVIRADDDDDENGAITGAGTITTTNLGLAAGEDIGTPGGAPLDVNVVSLAVNTDSDNDGAGGSVNIRDNDNDLIVASSVTGVLETVSGANSAGTLEIEAAAGDLDVQGDVTADNDIDLVALDDVSLDAAVTSRDNVNGAVVIRADSDNLGSGSISQTEGDVLTAVNVGLSAGDGGIGTAGADVDAFDIQATNLALETSGNANILDDDNGLNLIETVTGVVETIGTVGGTTTIGGSLELEADGGNTADLNINDDVSVGLGADFVADNDVDINENVTVTNNLVIRADDEGNDLGTIGGTGIITATGLGLSSAGDIDDGAGGPLIVDVDTFAVEGGGDVHVQDQNGTFIIDSVTGVDETVSGASAGGDLKLEATGTDLILNAAATAGGNVELLADNNVQLNASVTADDDNNDANDFAIIVADADSTGGGAITQTAGTVAANTVGLSAQGDIGAAGAGDIDINAANLVMESAAGSAFANDTAGDLSIIDTIVGDCFTVLGNTAQTDYRAESTGTITVADSITTTNGDIALVSTGGGIVVNSGQTVGGVGTTDLVLSAQGATGDISGDGTVVGTNVGLDARNIGTAANSFDVDAVNLTIDSEGDAYVADPNAVRLDNDAVATAAGDTVLGNEAAGDFRVVAGGDLVVGDAVDATDISLISGGNITVPFTVTATDDAVLQATGSITGGARVVGVSVGLQGDSIGVSPAAAFNIDAQELSVDAANDAYIAESGAVQPGPLTLVDNVTATSFNDGTLGDTVSGNDAGGDLRVTTLGALAVNAPTNGVSATDIDLVALGGSVTQTAGNIEADQNVVVNAATDIVQVQGATITGTEIGLEAGGNIGTAGADVDAVDIDATNLALSAGGNANILDSAGGLTLVDTVTAVAETVGATNAPTVVGGTLELEAAGGAGADLVIDNVVSPGGNADLVADNDVEINANINAAGNTVIIRADDDDDEDGAIIQGGGIVTADGLGLAAGEDIGTPGGAPLDVDVATLAVNTDSDGDGAGGSVNVRDLNGDLVVSAALTGVDETVSGANSAGSLEVEAAGGNLDLDGDATAGTNLDLVALGNIDLDADVDAGVNAVIRADSDNDGVGAITQTQGETITAVQLGLSAGDGGIGTAGLDVDAIDISVDDLALETSGNANILDDGGGLTIVEEVTGVVETVGLTGGTTTIGGSLELEADGGNAADLIINDDISVGLGADLVADNNVAINEDVTVTNNLVIRADEDDNGQGDISGLGNITATGLGLSAGGDIDDGAGGALLIDVTTFAVDGGENVFVEDQNGSFTIDSVTGVNETVSGATAGDDLKLVASGTDLILNAAATAGGNVELLADNDVILNASVTSDDDNNNANDYVIVGADFDGVGGGSISQTAGTITGNSVGLSAQGDIGAVGAGAVGINAANLSMETAAGSAYANDLSGDLTIINTIVGDCFVVLGNNADGDYRVETTGLLTVDDSITATEIALVSTGNGIAVNSGNTIGGAGTTNAVLSAQGATGDITGDGTVVADDVGLDARNIGASGNSFDIDADNLAVDAENDAFIEDANDVTLIDSVSATAANDTVDGNSAGNDFRVEAGTDLTVDATANGVSATDISLVAGGTIDLENGLVDATDDAVLDAGTDITQNNGTLQAADLGLSAGNDIGANGDNFEIDAGTLSVSAGNDAFIEDANDVTLVDSVTATAANDTVDGNSADNDFRVEAGGDLDVNAPTNGVSGNDISLISTGGDVNLDAGDVEATVNAVISANGSITQTVGTVTAQDLGLSATNGDIGTPGNAATVGTPLNIDADNLALNAPNGGANIADADGGLTLIDEVMATAANDTVTGTTLGTSLQLTAGDADDSGDSDLTIDDAVTVGTDIDLVAENNVIVNQAITSLDPVDGNVVIVADSDGDGPGGGGISFGPGGTVTAAGLGLSAGDDIGTAEDDGDVPLVIDVDTLAVQSGGDINIIDTDDGITLADEVIGVFERVSGAQAGGSLEIEAQDNNGGNDGFIVANGVVSAGTELELLAEDDITLNNNVTADTNAVVVADFDDDGNGAIIQNAGTISAESLGLSVGETSGSAVDPIDITVDNLAVDAGGADLFINDTAGGVTIVDEVEAVVDAVTPVDGIVSGNNARNLAINATNGDLTVDATANGITTTEDLDLTADGSVELENGDISAVNAALVAGTDITQNNGTINVTSLGLETVNGSVGTAANPFDFNAETVAIDVNDNIVDGPDDVDDGNAYLNDTADGVDIVDSVTGVTQQVSAPGAGANADNDLALTSQSGDIDVVATSITTGEDLELVALGTDPVTGEDSDINLQDSLINVGGNDRDAGLDGDGDNAVLSAAGDITQDAGGQLNVDNALGLATQNGSVGSAADPFDFDAVSVAVDVNDNTVDGAADDIDDGNAYLNDTADGVDIVDNVTAVVVNVGGVNADNDLAVTSQSGDIDVVAAGITVGEDLELVALGTDPVTGEDSDINLQDSLINVGGNDRDAGLDGDNDNAVLSAAGDITQDAGGQLNVDNALGLETQNGSVGDPANPLNIDAVELSVDTRDGTVDGAADDVNDGNAYVNDTAGGVAIVDQVTAINEAVSDGVAGVETDNDLSVTTQGGDLDVNTDITTGEDLELFAGGGNLNLGGDGAPVDINVGGVDRDPGLDGDGDNAVLGADGDITQVQGGTLGVDNTLGLVTTDGDIGSPTNPLDFDAVNLAIEIGDANGDGDGGNGYLNDTAGGVNVIDSVTAINIPVSAGINGATADNDLAISSQDGNLNINTDLTTGEDLELTARDGDNSGDDGNVNLGQPGTPVNINVGGTDRDPGFDGDGDNAIVIADGDIVQENGGQFNVDNALGLQTEDGDIGSPADPFEFDAQEVAVNSGDANGDGDGGSAYLVDTEGGLTLVDSVNSIVQQVNGSQAVNDLSVAANNGDLNVDGPVATGEDLELISRDGDLNFGPNARVDAGGNDRDAGRDGDGDNAVFIAGGDVNQDPNATINVDNGLGVEAGGNIGENGQPLRFDSEELSFNAGQDAYLEDTAGGVRVVDQVQAVNVPVNGNDVGRDVELVSRNGDLVIDADITAGRNGEFVTDEVGDIIINACIDVAENAIVSSAENIFDPNGTGKIRASGLGIEAPNGTIGTPDRPINVEVDRLAVGSEPAFINDPDGFQLESELTAIGRTVRNVRVPGGLDDRDLVVPLAQDNVNLVEDFLKDLKDRETADNDDNIYNETNWEPLDDEDFGLKKHR